MRNRLILCVLLLACLDLYAQKPPKIYTIAADSVLLSYCDSTEFILENHTQNVPGFLYNTGRGRTIFKRGVSKLNDSLYLIGADTLNLGARAWMQGGNSFGAPGILGTLDTNYFDLYTNGQSRARLTNAGHFLLGTTTDNGSLLQVNGPASIAGNANIGVATITSGGNLINTNAILFNHAVSEFHNFQLHDIYISRLENILYGYGYRFDTTTTVAGDGSVTIDIKIPAREFKDGQTGITYPGGKMCFSFWEGSIPDSVSVMMYANDYGRWVGPYATGTNLGPDVQGYMEVDIPGAFNYVNEIVVTLKAHEGNRPVLFNLEYMPGDGAPELVSEKPYVGKTGSERIYGNLEFYNKTDSVISHISGYDPSYFTKHLFVGATADNNSGSMLQVTGGMSATGNVQFSGLTGDNSQTRVLVSDGSGNLYYRDASTLAAGDPLRSSLAVNGTISAKRLRLSEKHWPDYVFKKDYALPSLPSLEKYIARNHHLPGVTPAAEAEQKGVDVGDNQAALLRKIEELTLYTISQDKQLTDQQKEINDLKARLERLEQLIRQ